MLKGNIYSLNRCPVYFTGGTVSSCEQSNTVSPGRLRNQFYSQAERQPISGIPNGYLAHASWLLPMQAGSLSSYKSEGVTITLSGNAVMGSNIDGSTTITLTALADADYITKVDIDGSTSITLSLAGDLTYIEKADIDGSMSITLDCAGAGELITRLNIDGTAPISINATATIDAIFYGVGSTTIALDAAGQLNSTIQGSGEATITLTGTGSLDALGVLAGSSTITLTGSFVTVLAYGYMSGDTGAPSDGALSADAIAFAVWAYLMSNSKTAEQNLLDAKLNAANAFAVSA